MDNQNFNNDYYGVPQPPFNERGQVPPAVNPAEGFEPQRPFAQPPAQPVQPAASGDGFNPIRHTAAYEGGAFEAPAYPQPGYGYAQPPQPQQPAPQPTDYSTPSYYNPQQDLRAAYQSYNEPAPQPSVQPQPPQPQQPYYAQPAQNPYGQPASAPAAAQAPKKSKGNKGLIIVIIVLSVLLAGSLGGILIYSLNNAAGSSTVERHKEDREDGGNGLFDNLPDFTFPDSGDDDKGDRQEPTTAPAHDESDYSDQTDKSYKGLALEKKPADAATGDYTAETAFEKAADAVVGVMCYSDDDEKSLASQGSGIIISSDGYMVTNAHVIGNSKNAYAIRVITEDGIKYTAGVVGFDSRTDIALLKLKDAKNLTAAVFGNSDDLKLGEDIIIIGNPGGLSYQNSMTKGIVSAIDREANSKNMVKYIQTDAAINPGNSGGPAVNLYGQVIGIASAKIVDEQYEGMGFCIPSATAKDIIDSLMKNGYIEGRVRIGISGYAVGSEEIQMYNLPRGIVIQEILADGPCDGTDLQPDDVITEADGTAITSFSDIYNVLENHKEGDKIKLKYYRYSTDKEGEVEITLQADK